MHLLFFFLLTIGSLHAEPLILPADATESMSPLLIPEQAVKETEGKGGKSEAKPEAKKEEDKSGANKVDGDKKDDGYQIKSSYGLFFNAAKDVNWVDFFLKVYLPAIKEKEIIKNLPAKQGITDEVQISGPNSYAVNLVVTKKDDKGAFDVKIVKSVPPLPIKVPKDALEKAMGVAPQGITIDFNKILKSPEVLALKEGEETKIKISADGKQISFTIKRKGEKFVINKIQE